MAIKLIDSNLKFPKPIFEKNLYEFPIIFEHNFEDNANELKDQQTLCCYILDTDII